MRPAVRALLQTARLRNLAAPCTSELSYTKRTANAGSLPLGLHRLRPCAFYLPAGPNFLLPWPVYGDARSAWRCTNPAFAAAYGPFYAGAYSQNKTICKKYSSIYVLNNCVPFSNECGPAFAWTYFRVSHPCAPPFHMPTTVCSAPPTPRPYFHIPILLHFRVPASPHITFLRAGGSRAPAPAFPRPVPCTHAPSARVRVVFPLYKPARTGAKRCEKRVKKPDGKPSGFSHGAAPHLFCMPSLKPAPRPLCARSPPPSASYPSLSSGAPACCARSRRAS